MYLTYMLSGGDNWRRIHGCERLTETKCRKTYPRDLQYGSWFSGTIILQATDSFTYLTILL